MLRRRLSLHACLGTKPLAPWPTPVTQWQQTLYLAPQRHRAAAGSGGTTTLCGGAVHCMILGCQAASICTMQKYGHFFFFFFSPHFTSIRPYILDRTMNSRRVSGKPKTMLQYRRYPPPRDGASEQGRAEIWLLIFPRQPFSTRSHLLSLQTAPP